MNGQLESWRLVFRQGLAPELSTQGLQALLQALEEDDLRLLQGSTCVPPPLTWLRDWPVEATCPIAFCGAVEHGGFGTATVGEVEAFFARSVYETDHRLGEAGAIKQFINVWDDSPRDEIRASLRDEVARELENRNAAV